MNPKAPTAVPPLTVVVQADDLDRRIRTAIADVLAEHSAERPTVPLLVGQAEMARLLDVSRATLHRLREQGCPCVQVGDVFKYEPERVLAWLRTRGQP
jgi:hypothetical protein